MFKAKITKIEKNQYYLNIPSLNLESVLAYSIGPRGEHPKLKVGDLVIASQLNDFSWIILGYVYGQEVDQ